jgi:hypothetical protein
MEHYKVIYFDKKGCLMLLDKRTDMVEVYSALQEVIMDSQGEFQRLGLPPDFYTDWMLEATIALESMGFVANAINFFHQDLAESIINSTDGIPEYKEDILKDIKYLHKNIDNLDDLVDLNNTDDTDNIDFT